MPKPGMQRRAVREKSYVSEVFDTKATGHTDGCRNTDASFVWRPQRTSVVLRVSGTGAIQQHKRDQAG